MFLRSMARNVGHGKRASPRAASLLRQLLCILAAISLLVLVVILPPASSTARSRVHRYRMEEMHQREVEQLPVTLFPDVNSTPHDAVTCGLVEAAAGERPVELNIFVVFHRQLYEQLYEDLEWNSLLSSFLTPTSSLSPTTREVVEGLQAYHKARGAGRSNGNRIYFLATREPLVKSYPSDMLRNRLLREWEMPGFVPSRRFLHIYSAIMTVYRSQMVGHSLGGTNSSGVAAAMPSASALGGSEEWVAFLEHDMRVDTQLLCQIRQRIFQQASGSRRCCIFYGESYNTMFLLHNPLGRQLMREYNAFFHTSLSLKDLPSVVATGAVVLPSALLHRIVPFLERVAELPLVKRRARHSSGVVATQQGLGRGWRQNRHLRRPLEVMGSALALSLGLERNYVHVEVPIRHLTQRELEELSEEY
ncbi:uncharacterized protein Tco025E_00261 [Trypanosoma conorhini]|uniref:Uncharacterized protein n=1 Tax=Trypanosoma conorhini TaxID=83891 RepID=A0A3R7P1U7_9TRYP|nr:uncharacterized protein Tco025E_00261 [Trypanosoma conorhini]RNF27524.1 hypothetical protein Tco025E_00261 [Trypanosoma conorhini]